MNATETKTVNTADKPQQDCGPKIEPQKEHQWLQRLVGEWTCEGEAMMKPGDPSIKWKATETVRSIGGLWVVGEGKGETPGGGASITMVTLGYDPQKKRYVGSFVGSMMANLWVYDGQLDAQEKVLTLDTEGPAMGGEPKTAKYRDIVEIKSEDHRVLSSVVQGDDGNWHEVMRANYHRVK
jgi:hypothetical protein